jgi:hypothetical protein
MPLPRKTNVLGFVRRLSRSFALLALPSALSINPAPASESAENPPRPAAEVDGKKHQNHPIELNHCSFGPTTDLKGPPCDATFSVCPLTEEGCMHELMIICGGRSIFQGIYTLTFGAQVLLITGAPYGNVGDLPTLALYFRRTNRRPDTFMFAVMNYKGINRQGDCHIERHPVPGENVGDAVTAKSSQER